MLIEEKIKKYEKLIKKERASLRKASQARANLVPEVSRKKITSANARYMRCAEYVDKLESKLEEMIEEAGCGIAER